MAICYATWPSSSTLLFSTYRISPLLLHTRKSPTTIATPLLFASPFPLSLSPSLQPPRSSSSSPLPPPSDSEEIFFDGGPHFGDLLSNLIFGLSFLWLPLTLAAVFRALFLRYRFTNLRVTILSGLIGNDRKDFSYKVVSDVKYVPRFIGEWGDVVITLSDGTQVEFKSLPKFKEIAAYCLERAGKTERVKGKGMARL